MPKNVCDLLHRDSGAQQARRCRVAQYVGAGQPRVEARPGICETDRASDRRRTDALPIGRAVVNEERPLDRLEPAATEIVHQSTRDPHRHRQTASSPVLSRRQRQDGRPPIHVVELDPPDVAGPQAEVEQAYRDGVVPSPVASRSVERSEQRLDLVVREDAWESGQPPVSGARHSVCQDGAAESAQVEKADEAPDGGCNTIGGRWRVTPSLAW